MSKILSDKGNYEISVIGKVPDEDPFIWVGDDQCIFTVSGKAQMLKLANAITKSLGFKMKLEEAQ